MYTSRILCWLLVCKYELLHCRIAEGRSQNCRAGAVCESCACPTVTVGISKPSPTCSKHPRNSRDRKGRPVSEGMSTLRPLVVGGLCANDRSWSGDRCHRLEASVASSEPCCATAISPPLKPYQDRLGERIAVNPGKTFRI